jgi:hypothetical protein
MCSLLKVLYLPVFLSVYTWTAWAQQAQQDPAAVAVATNSLAAMGAGALSPTQADSRATGVLTMHFDTPVTMNIVLESKGLTQTRAVLQQPAGTSIRVVNGGIGAIQNPDGSIRKLTQVNLFAERVGHIPVLSLLAEVQNPWASVETLSSAATNTAPDLIIAVSVGPSSDSGQAKIQRSLSRTLFYINQSTGLVDKVAYTSYSESPNPGIALSVQEVFSDYRTVAGVAVPFHKTTYLDGRLESDLQLNSVSFNVGLPSSDFVVPGGQP